MKDEIGTTFFMGDTNYFIKCLRKKDLGNSGDNFPFGRGDATKQVARFAMDKKKRRYEVVT